MSVTAETALPASPGTPFTLSDMGSDRRADLDAKQVRIANLLQEVGCEGLLVLAPDNFAWLTSGAVARGVLNPAEMPALYFSPDQRWVLCASSDSQRIFDEEIDGLGFQLKEWPWHWGRDQLLADLCHGRAIACDGPVNGCKPVGPRLQQMRRQLSPYEMACYRALGLVVSHALEATCRTMNPGETEREIAGQLSHRLLHRGAYAVNVQVAADGRSRVYRRCGFTSTPIRGSCVITATGRKYGLCATASRSVCFGPPDAELRKEHDAACKVSATYIASSWPDAMPQQILSTGRRVYLVSGYEHQWRLGPQGFVTGRAAVELSLLPQTQELFQPDWAVTWCSGVGAAVSCDTFVVSDQGPRLVTPTELWPLKRIRIQGAEFFRPDLLLR
jgi:Xaa-Pro aminopeptidase